jgi:hypothetical protein
VRPNTDTLHELALRVRHTEDIQELKSAEYVESLFEVPPLLDVVNHRARYAKVAGSAASAA